MANIEDYSALELRTMVSARAISAQEIMERYLHRIDALDPSLHAFSYVDGAGALEKARHCDARSDPPSICEAPLWGLPFADKDLTDRVGMPSSYGSRAFVGYVPPASSPIVMDMDRAGGISLGKTNVPECGFPAYGQNMLPDGGARNPWDLRRDPGGSSAGAAVATAARLLPYAPGNDGGGSVRIPAAACGLVGLKPTRGRVPGSSGIDSLGGLVVGGPLARSVEDTALLLDGMCRGVDRFALRAPAGPGEPYSMAITHRVRPLRIGWNTWSPWAPRYEIACDPRIDETLSEVLKYCERVGHTVEYVEPRPFPAYVDAFRAIWMGGAAALPVPEELFGSLEPLTQWLVRMGRARPAREVVEALSTLSRFEQQIIEDYAPFDVVLTPMLSGAPPFRGAFSHDDGELNFAQQCQFTPFTSYLNASGLPGISLPVAEMEESGVRLPVAIQAIGRPGDEVTLLQLGAQLQREYCWHERRPPCSALSS